MGADVEIGANTTIDRGAIDDTFVGEGTKLDNQIQLGHNVRVGKYCVMASCVGIAGSTTVGDHVMVGGAAMINGHIEIPSGSAVGPATAITGWGKEPKQLTGFFPALTKRDFVRGGGADCAASEMREELKNLQKQVAQLAELIKRQKRRIAERATITGTLLAASGKCTCDVVFSRRFCTTLPQFIHLQTRKETYSCRRA